MVLWRSDYAAVCKTVHPSLTLGGTSKRKEDMRELKAKVYCGEGCSPCRALCEWLDWAGVPYEKVADRSKFPPEITRVPTFELAGEFIRGFDRMGISLLLGKHDMLPVRLKRR